MEIAIVGHGFVGKAVDYGFPETYKFKRHIIDPIYGTSVKDLEGEKIDFAFVCVPTPMKEDGDVDITILVDVVSQLSRTCPGVIIVVKSTVVPDVLKSLSKLTPFIVLNPEFLTERNANADFVRPKFHLFGGDPDDVDEVVDLYKEHSKCDMHTPIYRVDLATASTIKYTINSFLALKVSFFNQIEEIFPGAASWNVFTSIVGSDPRIGNSHMEVPGYDGRRGWGGACFPKDTMALIKYAERSGGDLSVLKEAVRYNNKIRSQYTDANFREKTQKVKFDVEV